MITGTIYGLILNDREEREALAEEFNEAPFMKAPRAPVMYIKPRNCVSTFSAPIQVPASIEEVEIAATLGLLFDEGRRIAACCLAIDVSERHRNYYRPAIRERCRDGFLPLGQFTPLTTRLEQTPIVTRCNDQEAHRWTLERLVRPVEQLIEDISEFMTIGAGDLLLVGLAGDAPLARVGDSIEVSMEGVPTLRTSVVTEPAR